MFNINDKFVFADLPGYGYAKVSGKTQNEWQKSLEKYLLNREAIVSLIQLIDSRHPVQQTDLQMAEWIRHNNLPCFVIATKVDQIGRSQIISTCKKFEKELGLPVFPFCKTDKFYNQKIIAKIDEIISQ